jgi:hypothetical protein
MKTCNIEIIVPCADNCIDPAPRPVKHIPGTTNLRSSAFICGFFTKSDKFIILERRQKIY